MCPRTRVTEAVSVVKATLRIPVPRCLQTRGSTSYRCGQSAWPTVSEPTRSRAPRNQPARWRLGGCPRPGQRGDRYTPGRIRRQHTMVAMPVQARRDEGGEPLDELQGRQRQVHAPIGAWRRQVGDQPSSIGLYSGLLFLVTATAVFAPMIHRLLRRFHYGLIPRDWHSPLHVATDRMQTMLGTGPTSHLSSPLVHEALGDFCQRTYHLACLFVRLLCRDNSYIARLCACYRFLKTNENPAQSGSFFSGNRLMIYTLKSRDSGGCGCFFWARLSR
jgi:hypothetical protein